MDKIVESDFFRRKEVARDKGTREFAVFKAGDSFFGIDIMRVREIIRPGPVTYAPLTPPYVLGVFNLRGQIITIVDLSKRLAIRARQASGGRKRCIVVEFDGEKIGILVDGVQDVVEADEKSVELTPASLQNELGNFFSGVVRMQNRLVGILKLEKLLETD